MIKNISAVDKMLSRHYKILDLHLAGTYTQKQIAEVVGVSSATVRNIMNSPTFQHELAMRRRNREDIVDELDTRNFVDTTQRAREHIQEKAESAAEKITELINSLDSAIALRASQDVLDRAGIPRMTKTENLSKGAVVVLGAEDINRLDSSLRLAFGENTAFCNLQKDEIIEAELVQQVVQQVKDVQSI